MVEGGQRKLGFSSFLFGEGCVFSPNSHVKSEK